MSLPLVLIPNSSCCCFECEDLNDVPCSCHWNQLLPAPHSDEFEGGACHLYKILTLYGLQLGSLIRATFCMATGSGLGRDVILCNVMTLARGRPPFTVGLAAYKAIN